MLKPGTSELSKQAAHRMCAVQINVCMQLDYQMPKARAEGSLAEVMEVQIYKGVKRYCGGGYWNRSKGNLSVKGFQWSMSAAITGGGGKTTAWIFD